MALFTQRFLASDSHCVTECVLIHGWGSSSIIWHQWLATIREYSNVTVIDLPGYGASEMMDYHQWEELLAVIVAQLPDCAVYIGYSLGGMLALNIAERFPQRVQAVITLASNLKFVADQQWSQAMAQTTFDTFYDSVKNNPQQALKRFMALQVGGAAQEKTLLKKLRGYAEITPPEKHTLIQSLNCLLRIDNRPLLNRITGPFLQLFGEKDQLVPVGVVDSIGSRWSQQVVVINGAPHNLFLSHPQEVAKAIYDFLCGEKIIPRDNTRHLNKQQIARSFSRAASTYDSVAELQRRVGGHLLSYLPMGTVDTVLDLGCGTGFFSEQLQRCYPLSTIIGLDLAEGMVSFAVDHHHTDSTRWVCGDAESIPLASNSIDIVFSSLAIQWCEDIETLFKEIARVLKPGGSLVVSTLGPDTLHELRDAWRAVDDYIHVNQFIEKNKLIASIRKAGMTGRVESGHYTEEGGFDEQRITLEYDSLKKLTYELKSLGAHNVNSGRPVGLMGKQRMRTFVQAYESQRNGHGLLPASYQVWYGAWCMVHGANSVV